MQSQVHTHPGHLGSGPSAVPPLPSLLAQDLCTWTLTQTPPQLVLPATSPDLLLK